MSLHKNKNAVQAFSPTAVLCVRESLDRRMQNRLSATFQPSQPGRDSLLCKNRERCLHAVLTNCSCRWLNARLPNAIAAAGLRWNAAVGGKPFLTLHRREIGSLLHHHLLSDEFTQNYCTPAVCVRQRAPDARASHLLAFPHFDLFLRATRFWLWMKLA